MKASEMRNKSVAEQRTELLKLRKEQFALRLQRATGQAVKPDQFGKVRKNIARLKTTLRALAGPPSVGKAGAVKVAAGKVGTSKVSAVKAGTGKVGRAKTSGGKRSGDKR